MVLIRGATIASTIAMVLVPIATIAPAIAMVSIPIATIAPAIAMVSIPIATIASAIVMVSIPIATIASTIVMVLIPIATIASAIVMVSIPIATIASTIVMVSIPIATDRRTSVRPASPVVSPLTWLIVRARFCPHDLRSISGSPGRFLAVPHPALLDAPPERLAHRLEPPLDGPVADPQVLRDLAVRARRRRPFQDVHPVLGHPPLAEQPRRHLELPAGVDRIARLARRARQLVIVRIVFLVHEQ